MNDQERISIEKIMNDMKNNGIASALIRQDGIMIHSTFALEDASAGIMANAASVGDAILKLLKDKQKEMEVAMGGLYLITLPVKTYFLCGVLKQREQKTELKQYAEKLKQYL